MPLSSSPNPVKTVTAGSFGRWLDMTIEIMQTGDAAQVPCGACTACCHSSYFVHISPQDIETLRHVPAELLFVAPGLAPGNFLMGYDKQGRCPMFIDHGCSIYEHRPRTCRQYDCRVFAATGCEESGADKVLIAEQSARWTFEFPQLEDKQRFAAVQASARFLDEFAAQFPPRFLPSNPTQRAALAIEVHELFKHPANVSSDQDIQAMVAAIVDFKTHSS